MAQPKKHNFKAGDLVIYIKALDYSIKDTQIGKMYEVAEVVTHDNNSYVWLKNVGYCYKATDFIKVEGKGAKILYAKS